MAEVGAGVADDDRELVSFGELPQELAAVAAGCFGDGEGGDAEFAMRPCVEDGGLLRMECRDDWGTAELGVGTQVEGPGCADGDGADVEARDWRDGKCRSERE